MPVALIVVGNINVDFLFRAERLPSPGENLVARDMQISPGGKGANQAVAAARLGANVTVVGRVGRDPFGQLLTRNLEREKIDVSRVSVDPSKPTGTAIVTVMPGGENAILSALGANLALNSACIEQAFASIEEVDGILVQLGVPIASVDRVIQIGTDLGVPVFLDPTPIRDGFPRLWRYCTSVTPNQSEAAALLNTKVTNIATAFVAAESMHKTGVRRAVVKLGPRGCVLFDDDGPRRVRPYDVQVVDSTGAGDAFAAALAVRLTEGADFDDAAILASATAAMACAKAGAQSSLPTRQQVESFLSRRGKRKMLTSGAR
jgi:ribokinase